MRTKVVAQIWQWMIVGEFTFTSVPWYTINRQTWKINNLGTCYKLTQSQKKWNKYVRDVLLVGQILTWNTHFAIGKGNGFPKQLNTDIIVKHKRFKTFSMMFTSKIKYQQTSMTNFYTIVVKMGEIFYF